MIRRFVGRLLHRAGLSERLAPIAARDANAVRSRARQALAEYYDGRTTVYGWVPLPGYGVSCFANINDELIRPLMFYGTAAEEAEVHRFGSFVQPDDVIFDVGANYGLFSLRLFAGQPGIAALHLFEPNPTVFNCLQHTRRRTIAPLELHRCAVGDHTGDTSFYVPVPAASPHASLLRHQWGELRGIFKADAEIHVPMRTVDDIVTERHIRRIDGVKIDVEGAEDGVVAGMEATLSAMPPRVLMCETAIGSSACTTLMKRYRRAFVVEGERVRPASTLEAGSWGNVFFSEPR